MEAFAQLIIALIAIIVMARLSAIVAGRFGVPAATVQLIVGILLGPSLLNLLGAPIVLGTWGSPFANPLHDVLKVLAEVGLIELMFLAGLQTDWQESKERFGPNFSAAAQGFVLTAAGIMIATHGFIERWPEVLAMSAILAASGFGISVYHMNEMKFAGSGASNVISSVAALSGVLAILLVIASQATNYAMIYGPFKMAVAVSWFLGKLIMFFAVAYFLTSRFLKLTAKAGFQKRPGQALIGYLLLIASLYAWAAMHFGSFAAVGVASLGGALFGISRQEQKEEIERGLGSVLTSIPVGVFFIVFGMEVNLKGIEGHAIFLMVLFAMAFGTKLAGCWLAARKVPEDISERSLIMSGTLTQGEMGMLIAAYAFSRGLLSPISFNSAIIVVVALTLVMPFLMKKGGKFCPKESFLSIPLKRRRDAVIL